MFLWFIQQVLLEAILIKIVVSFGIHIEIDFKNNFHLYHFYGVIDNLSNNVPVYYDTLSLDN